MAAGRFREDLFHRINVVRLTLPPLREHKEDIPLLIERFLAAANGRFLLSNDAMEAIMDYDWPGNVRELKNCLERMMAFNSGPLLHFADLPSALANYVRAREHGGGGHGRGRRREPGGSGRCNGVVPLHELERRAIQHALNTRTATARWRRSCSESGARRCIES